MSCSARRAAAQPPRARCGQPGFLIQYGDKLCHQHQKEGKVYIPAQVGRAIQNFFRKGNLIALRELALRRTADRVDAQMREYRETESIAPIWQVKERLIVCIGADDQAERIVRGGRRLAKALEAE